MTIPYKTWDNIQTGKLKTHSRCIKCGKRVPTETMTEGVCIGCSKQEEKFDEEKKKG